MKISNGAEIHHKCYRHETKQEKILKKLICISFIFFSWIFEITKYFVFIFRRYLVDYIFYAYHFMNSKAKFFQAKAQFFSQWITLLVCCQRDLSMQGEKIHQVNFNEFWNWLECSWMYQKYTYLLWIDCKHWTFIFFECNHREHLLTEAVIFQNVEMKFKCVPTKKNVFAIQYFDMKLNYRCHVRRTKKCRNEYLNILHEIHCCNGFCSIGYVAIKSSLCM